jgi:hypothetical protein
LLYVHLIPFVFSGLLEEVLSDSEELEELLFDSAGFSEVPGCSELSGAAGPSPPLQPANKPDAATIAAPFIKSRRVTFRLMVFSSFLRPQFIQCLKIHKIS